MHKQFVIIIAVLSLLISACSANLKRNDDGSWRFEVVFTEEAIASEINRAIKEPTMRDLEVDLKTSYILVTGENTRASGSKTDVVNFTLTLGVSGGHLTAVITNATLNDLPIEQSRIDKWNADLAASLEKNARERENSTLVQVVTAENDVTFVYRIEAKK